MKIVLDEKAEEVDKKRIEEYMLNPDGSIGDKVMPYPPTERFEVKEASGESKGNRGRLLGASENDG